MNATEVRMTSQQWRDLEATLFARTDVETKAFALAESVELEGSTVLAVREVVATPEHAYEARTPASVVIREDHVRGILEQCFSRRLSLIDVHTHPWRRHAPQFSSIDDRTDLRRYRYTHPIMHGAGFGSFRHASLVFAPGMQFQGRAWHPSNEAIVPVQRIRVTGPTLMFAHGTGSASDGLPAALAALYDRQVRAFGTAGQAVLRSLTVAVVGAGGLGSQVVQALALLGVGSLVLIDPDVVEESNANRLVGAFAEHFDRSSTKVRALNDALGRMLNPPEVIALPLSALDVEAFPYLAGADVIVGAVDSAAVRVHLNRVAAATLTPYLDGGVGVRAEGGRPVAGGGQVQVILPGFTPCLNCLGVTAPAARHETLSDDEKAIYRKRGYIQGEDVKAPQVVFLNGVVANLLVTEFVKLVTGFGRVVPYVYYDLLGDRLPAIAQAIDLPPRWDECLVCGADGALAAGARGIWPEGDAVAPSPSEVEACAAPAAAPAEAMSMATWKPDAEGPIAETTRAAASD